MENDEIEYQESPEYLENKLGLSNQPRPKFIPMKTQDDNWDLLKQEKNTPYTATVDITKVTNIKAFAFANTKFNKGNLKCSIYRGQEREDVSFNFQFRDHKYQFAQRPKHYKVWDLIKTIGATQNLKPYRSYMYKPHKNDEWTTELSLIAFANPDDNYLPTYLVLLVNDHAVELDTRLEANCVITGAWYKRKTIDDYYKENLQLV